MRTKVILKYIGFALLFNALFLFISAFISLYFKESSFIPLFYNALVCSILGALPTLFVESIEKIRYREGITISVFGWLTTCLFGSMPYFMWGGSFTFVNAFFESVSGYTTTGATILKNIEELPKGLLFWRSSTHFIGGIGVILFVLLILPNSKGAQSSIYRSEVSGLARMNFNTRSKHIIRIISIVYISLTIILTILLRVQGMSLFDAVCHSFSTIATGGFSTKNESIAYFNNIGIEITVTVFMFLSSLHFGLLYMTFTRDKKNIFNSPVVRAYTFSLIVGIVLVAFNLYKSNDYSLTESIRYSSFQVVSLASTTGSATVNTDSWPFFSKIILYYFMFQCAMVGSTGGGMKFDRIYLFFLSLKKQLKKIIHPQGVYISKINSRIITDEIEIQAITFMVTYILVFLVVTLMLAAIGVEGETALSASVTTIGNVGPGFSEINSMSNFSEMPFLAKYLLSANMLVGRLEILNVFTLFITLFGKNQ